MMKRLWEFALGMMLAAAAGAWAVSGGGVPFPLINVAQTYQRTSDEVSCGIVPTNFGYPPGDVRRFGATGDGATDDTAAIQNAINCLPVSGGTLTLAANATYKVTSPLTVGNGSSSTASTTYGQFIVGAANNVFQTTGYPNANGTRILWAGSTNLPVISLQGPLLGWGVKNLYIDCNNTAGSVGLLVTSASYGESANLRFQNCGTAKRETVVGALPAGISNINSQHNAYSNITVRMPALTGAVAMEDTGNSLGNTCYEEVRGLFIVFPGSPPGNETAIHWAASDNVRYSGVHITNTQATNTTVLNLDYSIVAGWPADNVIENVDFGLNNPPIINTGTPSGATPNRAFRVSSTNGAHTDPALTNFVWDLYSTTAVQTTGTFTATLSTGCTTTPTMSLTWVKTGNVVTLSTRSTTEPVLNCTANSTDRQTDASLPASIRPTVSEYAGTITANDNAANVVGCMLVLSTGQLRWGKVAGTQCGPPNFTNSGTTGIDNFTITYLVN